MLYTARVRLFRRRHQDPVLPVATNAVGHLAFTGQDLVSAFWAEVAGRASHEQVGTVSRCLQLNAAQIASMPLRYEHREQTAGREPRWVSEPDPAWFPNGIKQAMFAVVWSMYARGDAFLYVTSRYEDGYPRTWTLLDATTMSVRDDGGVRGYRSNGTTLDPDDVLQIPRNPTGALRGTSALEAYAANVQSAWEADAFTAEVYGGSGVNRVALKSTRRLTADQASDVQGQWVNAVANRLGAPAIIPPDLELVEALSISPKDLMLLESREWDARQIAAAFGVPAMLLNIAVSGGLTYQNPEQLFGLWWRSELMPTAVQIQEALSRWTPTGHWVAFDPSVTVRPDQTQQVAIYSKAYADGAVSVDEYRAAVFGLPPLALGDASSALFEQSGTHASQGSPTAEEVLT